MQQRSQFGRARSALSLVLVYSLVTVALLACRPPREDPVDGPAPSPGVAQPSPRLPNPIAEYMSPAGARAFQRIVDSLYFGGGEAGRPGGPGTARLYVEAMSGANTLNPAHTGSNGTIVARLYNLGGGNDPVFGTQPGPAFSYYILVQPGQTADSAEFTLLQLNRAGNPQLDFARKQGQPVTGSVVGCPEPYEPHSLAAANFRGCAQHAPAPEESRAQGSTILESLRGFFTVSTAWAQTSGGVWYSCSPYGCCELRAR